MDLALNKQQRLISYNTQPTNQQPYFYRKFIEIDLISFLGTGKFTNTKNSKPFRNSKHVRKIIWKLNKF